MSTPPPVPLDDVVVRLQEIRRAAGQPSFGDVALGVSQVRRARGMTPEQSRVGRTTVYDAFRVGRRRLDPDLVADIVRALGQDEATADEIATRCREAQVRPRETSDESATVASAPSMMAPQILVWMLLGCIAVNLVGRVLVDALGLPLYLDMIGTAFSAVVLGPWWGALVGLVTNVLGANHGGTDSLWFAPVNVVGALVWGYGARRWRMARSIPQFFLLNLLVAVVCTSVAATTIVTMLGGFTGHGSDDITASVLVVSESLWVSVFVSNLLTSISDKLICGFASLALIESLPPRMRVFVPTSWMRGDRDQHLAVRACSGLPERA